MAQRPRVVSSVMGSVGWVRMDGGGGVVGRRLAVGDVVCACLGKGDGEGLAQGFCAVGDEDDAVEESAWGGRGLLCFA